MSYTVLFLIIGMAVVTYIPRALPAIVIDRLRLNPKLEKFLGLIPYTAMAALIFPGVIFVDNDRPEMGIVGGIAAGILAWLKKPVIVCVIAAIAIDLLLYLIY